MILLPQVLGSEADFSLIFDTFFLRFSCTLSERILNPSEVATLNFHDCNEIVM